MQLFSYTRVFLAICLMASLSRSIAAPLPAVRPPYQNDVDSPAHTTVNANFNFNSNSNANANANANNVHLTPIIKPRHKMLPNIRPRNKMLAGSRPGSSSGSGQSRAASLWQKARPMVKAAVRMANAHLSGGSRMYRRAPNGSIAFEDEELE